MYLKSFIGQIRPKLCPKISKMKEIVASSICPYVVSSNFLVHFFKLYFLERLYDNLTKKYGWHFFGGHFE